MIDKIYVFCLFFVLCVCESIKRPRGVPLSMLSLYPIEGTFTCFDGSAVIPFDRINDDYCDCIYDGSDEPGTSACPNSSFHCTNRGYKPFFIPSSRVNDGICDCCDASDEYESGVSCKNNCYELGQAVREEEARKTAMFKEGNKLRHELSLKGKQVKREKQLRLLELTKEQTEAELLKIEKETTKNLIEEQEKTALDAYKQLSEENRKVREGEEKQRNEEEALVKFKELDRNGDGFIDKDEILVHEFFDQNKDGQISDDEMKLILTKEEKVSFETFLSHGWQYIKQIFAFEKMKEQPNSEDLQKLHGKEEQLGKEKDTERYGDGEEEDEERDDVEPDDDVEEEVENQSNHSDDSKIEYDEETRKVIEDANSARTEYDNAVRNLRDIQREIKQIEEILNKDYGNEDEFVYLVGECFDFTDREYTYKLCPFDQITQRPKDGGIETSLGMWSKWVDDKYEFMLYDKGQSCWNGPERHTQVMLKCNLRTEIVSAGEPNRCEYLLEFHTPSMCMWKETQESIDEVHDEL